MLYMITYFNDIMYVGFMVAMILKTEFEKSYLFRGGIILVGDARESVLSGSSRKNGAYVTHADDW